MHTVEEETVTPARYTERIPMSSRIQSPTNNPFPLGSNDDDLERAQARAARAASIRCKSAAATVATSFPSRPNLLEHGQIMDLLHNCLKLARENKINQKNTWELNLIDHLSEIIQSKPEEDDAENNFQKLFWSKVSCTLETGVKIYSLRVDSLHSEAYKVLGGINRIGREEECENAAEGNHAHVRNEQEGGLSRKNIERKLSPLSTLEASFEALNVKKFDVAFIVDPLYHQMSAQFDEDGAKGLLLNNLGVYGSCCVLFDSFEVPEKFILNDAQYDKSELIDLSFCKEYLDQMLTNMPKKAHISPTLRGIMNRFGENNHRPQNVLCVEEQPVGHGETDDIYDTELEDNSFNNFDLDTSDHDDHRSVVDDNSTRADPFFTNHREEIAVNSFPVFDKRIRIEEIANFLSFGLGFTSKTNAWAGPDYWKYKKSKVLEQVLDSIDKQELTTNKTEVKKSAPDIDFTKFLEKEFSNLFAQPKNPKSILLPTNRTPCKFTLQEDCQYKPESLAKLFILPDVLLFGKKARILHDDSVDPSDDFASASWDRESINDDYHDDGNSNDDTDDLGSLVRLPRQVPKQLDVHALKEMLWMHIHGTIEKFGVHRKEASVSLRQAMHRLQDSSSADLQKDISSHLFFVCLLHLANEHGLILHQQPTLDDVAIDIQASAFMK